MKKIITRSLSIVLAIMTVFSCISSVGFALDEIPLDGVEAENSEILQNDDPEIPEEAEEAGETEDPEETENPVEPEAPEESEYAEDTVALMYLCSNTSGFPSLGHIWAYFENVSDKTIMVGAYDLPPNEGVSVGLFGLTRSDGFGLHYNVESYTYNRFAKDSDPNNQLKVARLISLCTELNSEKMERISNRIRNVNWWDPIIFNCVTFAVSTWNMAGAGFIFPWTLFPGITRANLQRRNAKGGLQMFDPPRDRVYKQVGRGSSAGLRVVKDSTVDTPPG